MAAWTDGSLNEVAEKPSWWRRDEPGLRLKKSTIELRVTDDGLELVVPDDFALDSSAKTAIEKEFPTFNGVHLTIAQTERDGALADEEDRVQRITHLVTVLAAAGL